MRIWNFIAKDGSIDDQKILIPLKWGRRKGVIEEVKVVPDIFEHLRFETLDLIFAVMSACGGRPFMIETKSRKRAQKYFADVERRGKIAGPKYEKELRAHFKKYKMEFMEGYSLPEPPTPEMRAIYDSAAKREKRPTNPCGTTLWSGFSGGEYHWRKWPLDNVSIKFL